MIYQFANLKRCDGLVHAVTTACVDGISNFNLADHVGPDTDRAIGYRQKICDRLDLDFNRLTVGQQVHRPNITLVTEENAGRGNRGWNTAIPDTDALVTGLPATPLMVLSADCPLVLVFDPIRKALAVIHASWRCTFARIIPNAVECLTRNFKTNPADCLAGIGPGAGPCCYQVDEPFVATLRARPELLTHVIERDGDRFFDLWAAVKAELIRAGLKPEHIDAMNKCTICDDQFFSFRRQRDRAGRFGLIAAIK